MMGLRSIKLKGGVFESPDHLFFADTASHAKDIIDRLMKERGIGFLGSQSPNARCLPIDDQALVIVKEDPDTLPEFPYTGLQAVHVGTLEERSVIGAYRCVLGGSEGDGWVTIEKVCSYFEWLVRHRVYAPSILSREDYMSYERWFAGNRKPWQRSYE